MSGTFTNLLYHFIFSIKNRQPLIASDFRLRLYEYMGGIIKKKNAVLYAVGGTSDHIHLLVLNRPNKDISSLLRDLKSNSSRWVHETFPEQKDFAWQDGFGAFTVSQSQVEKVIKYIESQEEHHEKSDFKIEFIRFLKAHNVEYDERFIWE